RRNRQSRVVGGRRGGGGVLQGALARNLSSEPQVKREDKRRAGRRDIWRRRSSQRCRLQDSRRVSRRATTSGGSASGQPRPLTGISLRPTLSASPVASSPLRLISPLRVPPPRVPASPLPRITIESEPHWTYSMAALSRHSCR